MKFATVIVAFVSFCLVSSYSNPAFAAVIDAGDTPASATIVEVTTRDETSNGPGRPPRRTLNSKKNSPAAAAVVMLGVDVGVTGGMTCCTKQSPNDCRKTPNWLASETCEAINGYGGKCHSGNEITIFNDFWCCNDNDLGIWSAETEMTFGDCVPKPTVSPTKSPTQVPTKGPTRFLTPVVYGVCGCPTIICSEDVLDRIAGDYVHGTPDYTCRARMEYLQTSRGFTQLEACARVGGVEFPRECGGCDPDLCYDFFFD